ncbi:hypothetical protein BCV69DRAFT_315271 [Microstroma glucosiphilum]|uniref:Uncharacterized protein n=1 Tax=Pseudomicrostroma glucosiphilum TaxID=1684307 RepID=A0A316TW21_9BASI|nr:hypothetical protein BCV69DRAFT_315271 [Pseudomicrostroma glucosiphilum]PWN17719.1 hypothetical protein BCV69DRAFT_315271 [Pseudomicrostroma glucosiphilum]
MDSKSPLRDEGSLRLISIQQAAHFRKRIAGAAESASQSDLEDDLPEPRLEELGDDDDMQASMYESMEEEMEETLPETDENVVQDNDNGTQDQAPREGTTDSAMTVSIWTRRRRKEIKSLLGWEIRVFQRCKDIRGTVVAGWYRLASPNGYPRSSAHKLMLQPQQVLSRRGDGEAVNRTNIEARTGSETGALLKSLDAVC